MANEHALAAWRKSKNISQDALAEKLGVSRWMINSIETGRRRPSMALAVKIRDFTQAAVTPNDLVAA